jgi:chromate transport protein ChrA
MCDVVYATDQRVCGLNVTTAVHLWTAVINFIEYNVWKTQKTTHRIAGNFRWCKILQNCMLALQKKFPWFIFACLLIGHFSV